MSIGYSGVLTLLAASFPSKSLIQLLGPPATYPVFANPLISLFPVSALVEIVKAHIVGYPRTPKACANC